MSRHRTAPFPVAIIGMSCRVPGARNYAEFWRNLCNGTESIHFFNDDELRAAGVAEDALAVPHYVKAAPLLDDYDCFDAQLFRYSPKKAAWTDPQQRVFMECAWEALEDAGIDPHRTSDAIGVYAGGGGSISDYLFAHADQFREHLGATASSPHLGNDKDFLATHASYALNLRGPSVTVQTACSTSLVAVHLACQSLYTGDADLALAGGTCVRIPHLRGYYARNGDIFSPEGHCRPFDADARGTLFGSGVALVVLKPLDHALADRDHIWAVIRGSAINNDGGEKLSYTASSVEGQVRAVRTALAAAAIDPATIGYVEAHGTATTLGDPLEVQALNRAFDLAGSRGSCAIGSVKANVGHLESVAGVVALIKAVLMLKYGVLPPSINFDTPNPRIDFEGGPFFVNRERCDWPRQDHPRRASVNALGIGGTNAHVILEAAPEPTPAAATEATSRLLCLSARNEAALRDLIHRYVQALEARPAPDWANVCHTANTGRTQLSWRLAVLADNAEQAALRLRDFVAGREAVQLWAGNSKDSRHDVFSQPPTSEANLSDSAERLELLKQVAQEFVLGQEVASTRLSGGERICRKVPLPTYPFRRVRHGLATS
ncbi:MAG TPA: beta-ketoacyl synthase N-terminal-like domain-containing protein [Pirellulaceae bacterium]|nr:beta-ketoacyl synthase N-terminal-like domain-containing protein [Pirellulaceae bacterium]